MYILRVVNVKINHQPENKMPKWNDWHWIDGWKWKRNHLLTRMHVICSWGKVDGDQLPRLKLLYCGASMNDVPILYICTIYVSNVYTLYNMHIRVFSIAPRIICSSSLARLDEKWGGQLLCKPNFSYLLIRP